MQCYSSDLVTREKLTIITMLEKLWKCVWHLEPNVGPWNVIKFLLIVWLKFRKGQLRCEEKNGFPLVNNKQKPHKSNNKNQRPTLTL